MLFILAIAISSSIVVEVLSRRKMKTALAVYCVAYILIMAWAALMLGLCFASETEFSGWAAIPDFQQLFSSSIFHAISALSIFGQSAVIVVIAIAVLIVATGLVAVFYVGHAVYKLCKKHFAETLDIKKSKLYSFVSTCSPKISNKIYLRLCRFIN